MSMWVGTFLSVCRSSIPQVCPAGLKLEEVDVVPTELHGTLDTPQRNGGKAHASEACHDHLIRSGSEEGEAA